jgi:universal stress protein family protein
MGLFPTRILLATDGSEEAELAALRAVDLAERTDSELHVVHIGVVPSFLRSDPGTHGYDGKLYEQFEEESRELLRKQTWREGGRRHCSRVSPQDGGGGPGGCGFGQGARGGPDHHGLPGPQGDKEGHRGEYLRCGYPPRSLPSARGALARERPRS